MAKLCMGDSRLEKLNSIEKSIMAGDIATSLKLKNDEIKKISDDTYSSIKNHTKNNKGLDFRYCGIEH